MLCRFLGYFQPQQDKPALWELDSDQHYTVGRNSPNLFNENARYTEFLNCKYLLFEISSSKDFHETTFPNNSSYRYNMQLFSNPNVFKYNVVFVYLLTFNFASQ